jgi:acylphosphatase
VKRVRVLVSGRVQGVWFRGSTERVASRLGLHGHARNLADGRVEVVLEGEDARVDEALAFVRRGPPHARVDRVEEHAEVPRGLGGGFHVE